MELNISNINTRIKAIASATLLIASINCMATEKVDTTMHNLNDIVVTGSRYKTDVRHLPVTISIIPNSILQENYRDNILPTLTEQVPGLFVTSRGLLGYGVSTGAAGGIKVRGIGSTANLLVLVDGLPQYAGLYGHPIADAYQTMLADKVEVLRGPASMIYGSNAMGGVVNIVTRQMTNNGTTTNVRLQGGSYGTVEATATNRFRKNKFSSIVGGNYGRTDGHRPNSKFEQISGFIKLRYDFSPNWNLSGNTNITHFKSSNPGEAGNPIIDNDMKIMRGMAAISLTNEYDHSSGAVRLFYNWGHHHINDGYYQGDSPRTAFYLHNDNMGGFSMYQSWQLFNGNNTTAGVDYLHYGGHAWNRSMADGSETDIAKHSVNEVAGYVDFRQRISSWLIFDGGIRWDHHAVSGNEWIPQSSLSFLLPKSATIRITAGKGFRNATIRELYMYRPANASLKPERLMNYELAYRQHLMNNKMMIGANVFYLKADNMIQTQMIDGRPLNVNTGKTENSGFELEATWNINPKLSLNSNYSFLHMSNPQLSAPKHKLFVGGSWHNRNIHFNTGLQYVSGLYTTVGSNEHKESFIIWNATASYEITKGLHFFVKGENILAQKYETVTGFPMPRATFMGGIDWNF